jgi:hypothetical protein
LLPFKLSNPKKTVAMKNTFAFVLVAATTAFGAYAAEPSSQPAESLSDSQRIDYLLRLNQSLMDEIQRLTADFERPKTKEETFVACMQAAKGQTSAMAAESIGSHCDQLLKAAQ